MGVIPQADRLLIAISRRYISPMIFDAHQNSEGDDYALSKRARGSGKTEKAFRCQGQFSSGRQKKKIISSLTGYKKESSSYIINGRRREGNARKEELG